MRIYFFLKKPGHLRLLEPLISRSDNCTEVKVFFTLSRLPQNDRLFIEEFAKRCPSVEFIVLPFDDRFKTFFSEYLYSQLYIIHYLKFSLRAKPHLRQRAFGEVSSYYPLTSLIVNMLSKNSYLANLISSAFKLCIFALNRNYRSKSFMESFEKPDLVYFSPYIELWSNQISWLLRAKSLNIPTVYAVHSWDNLTNKGPISVEPDFILVWNSLQLDELKTFHAISEAEVFVVGAYGYDKWFEHQHKLEKREFIDKYKLPISAEKYTLLILGSSKSISSDKELVLVDQLAKGLEKVGWQVIYRQHPQNILNATSSFENLIVFPEVPKAPVLDEDVNIYRDTIEFSDVVLGINTSGMFEAMILGKKALNLSLQEFSQGQNDTIHYRYIENAEVIEIIRSIDTLVDYLAKFQRRSWNFETFFTRFIRPQGISLPATKNVFDVETHILKRQLRKRNRFNPFFDVLNYIVIMILVISLMALPLMTDLVLTRKIRARRARKHKL